MTMTITITITGPTPIMTIEDVGALAGARLCMRLGGPLEESYVRAGFVPPAADSFHAVSGE
jgi:hypothetical protein